MSPVTLAARDAELLVLCARQQLSDDLKDRVTRLLPEPLDWTATVDNARRHGIGPLLFDHLQLLNKPNGSVPPAVLHRLRQTYVRATFRAQVHFSAISQVLARFADAHVPVILLKGAALASRIYRDPALRPFADIDLLVRQTDIDRAKQILAATGFELSPELLSEALNRKYHVNLPFVRRAPVPVHIELHWRLTDSFTTAQFQEDEIFAESRQVEVVGARAAILDPADEFVYLAAHLDNHGYLNRSIVASDERRFFVLHDLSGNRLIWLTDLHELIEQGVDWCRILARANQVGASGALAVSLRMVRSLFATPLDLSILRDLPLPEQSWTKRKLAQYVFSLADTAPAPTVERFRRRFLVTRKSFELRLIRLVDLRPNAFTGGLVGVLRCGWMIFEFLWRRALRTIQARSSA